MKAVVFHHKAKEAIRSFPELVKKSIGKALFDLQKGHRLGMPVSRTMSSVKPGVEELRIKDASGAYRVFYFTKSERGILVFHAFTKKTQRTSLFEIELGRRRLKELLDEES
jgi:phage-related protein